MFPPPLSRLHSSGFAHVVRPGTPDVLFQDLVPSLAFPDPTQATPGPLNPRRPEERAQVSSSGRPEPCTRPLPGAQQSPRGAESCTSRTSLGSRVQPGTPGLARAAPPGGGGCGPNSAASPCSSWPPSSPAFWRSSAAPLPGPCWPTTPGGARGSGAAAAGPRRPGAEAGRVQPARAANTQHTHTTYPHPYPHTHGRTPGGGGALPFSPPLPSGRPASDVGEGVACTKYRLQGLAGARIAPAKIAGACGSGLRSWTRLREKNLLLEPFPEDPGLKRGGCRPRKVQCALKASSAVR